VTAPTAPARIQTFEAFWPFYLGEHSLPLTRTLHFIGTTIAALLIVSAVVTMSPAPLLGALFSGYLWAWVSHYFVEKNRPATFTYPAWSFIADWKMWAFMATRKLDAELKRHNITPKSIAAEAAVKS
jgi:hypothetical protein